MPGALNEAGFEFTTVGGEVLQVIYGPAYSCRLSAFSSSNALRG
jgi:hypothetical protein